MRLEASRTTVGYETGRRPRQKPDMSAGDSGYEYTLDLADTVNLPDEDGKPPPDEILARYTTPSTPPLTRQTTISRQVMTSTPTAANSVRRAMNSPSPTRS